MSVSFSPLRISSKRRFESVRNFLLSSMSTAHMPNVQRQKMGQPYWQASDASSHTSSTVPSRKYYDYFPDKYSPEGSLICQQVRDAQKSQSRRNPRQRSSLVSPRAAFTVQSAAYGYADTFRKQPSRALPGLESPASSHLDSARQSHYSAHSFDYYRTAGMHNKMPSLSTVSTLRIYRTARR